MNNQNNQVGDGNNIQQPIQPIPETPAVPEMPALAQPVPEAPANPVPEVPVQEPVAPAIPEIAPAQIEPAIPEVAPTPVVVEADPVPAPMPVPEAPVVAPAPVTPEVPVAPAQPAPVADPMMAAQPTAPVQPAPTPAMPAAPEMAPAPVMAPVPPVAPMQPAAPVQTMVQPTKTNGLCIAAIIFAFLMPLIGLILGIAGMVSAKKKGQKGKGLGIAAIIFSLLMPIVWAFAIIALIGGSLFGAINGDSEAAKALQTGCASLDEYGDYESGFVSCDSYTCVYDDGTTYLSSSCNLIDTEDEDDDIIVDDEEEVVTPTTPTITLPSTKWLFSDDSEIVFEETAFKWYRDENVYTDNYYIGTYKFFTGAEAETYLTVDLKDYGITLEELQGVYSRNEEYSQDNLVLLVLDTTSAYIDGQTTVYEENIIAPYYGFAISDTSLDIASMNSGTYSEFTKKTE